MRYDTKQLTFLNPHIMICDRCGTKQFDHEHFFKILCERFRCFWQRIC